MNREQFNRIEQIKRSHEQARRLSSAKNILEKPVEKKENEKETKQIEKESVKFTEVVQENKIPVESKLKYTSQENQKKFINAVVEIEKGNVISKKEIDKLLELNNQGHYSQCSSCISGLGEFTSNGKTYYACESRKKLKMDSNKYNAILETKPGSKTIKHCKLFIQKED